MAAASAVSRLIVYVATCAVGAATARHGWHRGRRAGALPRAVRPVIPAAAMTIALVIVLAATPAQLVGGAFTLAVGAALFLIARRLRSDP